MAKHAVNGFRNELCGRVNRSGPIPRDMRSSAGSSIVLEGCSFQGNADHAFGAEVYLVEIPAQLVIRDSWMQAEVSRPFPSWNRPILTEIYLCHACSCQEILRTETAGQGIDTARGRCEGELPPPRRVQGGGGSSVWPLIIVLLAHHTPEKREPFARRCPWATHPRNHSTPARLTRMRGGAAAS